MSFLTDSNYIGRFFRGHAIWDCKKYQQNIAENLSNLKFTFCACILHICIDWNGQIKDNNNPCNILQGVLHNTLSDIYDCF